MLDLSWPTLRGEFYRDDAPVHIGAAAFVDFVTTTTGFWLWDSPLKYLSINLDTREDGRFTLRDRDGSRIHADRVLRAIARHREAFGQESAVDRDELARERSAVKSPLPLPSKDQETET